MKKTLLFLALATSIFMLNGCGSDTQKNKADNSVQMTQTALAAEQQTAPNFTFIDLATGQQVKLSDLQGKPVFLNFWATWCPPCVGEMPHIQKAYEKYNGQIHFVAISLDDEQEEAKKFLQNKGYTFPGGYGNVNELGQKYQLDAIPSSYLIDAQGNIKGKMIGAMDEQALTNFLQQAL